MCYYCFLHELSVFKKIKLFFKKIFVKPNFEKSIKSEKTKYLKKITKESKDVERYITYKINEFEYQINHMEKVPEEKRS